MVSLCAPDPRYKKEKVMSDGKICISLFDRLKASLFFCSQNITRFSSTNGYFNILSQGKSINHYCLDGVRQGK